MRDRKEKSKVDTKTFQNDFVAPDGGWGWIIIVACGISNLCVLPVLQNFGLIFLERFSQLGLSSSEITTIINVNMAVTSILAAGMGVILSANALALNTYFKKKRRIAVGLSWTCTGIGPIIMPQIITLLIPKFGVSGTVLILGAVTFNSIASALLLQPVSWHAKKLKSFNTTQTITSEENNHVLLLKDTSENHEISNESSTIQKLERFPNVSFIRQGCDSQYLYCDNEQAIGIDIIASFSESGNRQRKISCQEIVNQSLLILAESLKGPIPIDTDKAEKKEDEMLITLEVEVDQEMQEIKKKNKSTIERWIHEVIIFFDLDVLKDHVFVTLMLGINFALFVEMNFSILTPFILSEYGLTKRQIATVLSILAAIDVIVRLSVSFFASKIGWENRTFFLFGIACLAAGRTVIAHISSYNVIIATSVLIGFGKGLRTVFMALVIPSHVSLSKLPAASGIQLASSGIIYPFLGPLVGWIHDKCGSYTILLHVLNIITYATIIAWTIEAWITSKSSKERKLKLENSDNYP
ncbi:monocarboxylate transporter 12-like isoform X2 [Aphidius gifuensis]|uniref:monocarboxylate transporter 12-like isoform X2 n=1 Tax=Aphidius gifuensis TaxID=684658 RepID=UPI001CDD7586|nr:monocarboxylate transporter 12-like isoform X2 [Aphidius gifuensis]